MNISSSPPSQDLADSGSRTDTPPSPTTDPWSNKIEDYVKKMRDKCLIKMDQHDRCSNHYKKRDVMTRLPTLILPSIFAPLVLLMANEEDPCAKSDHIQISSYLSTSGFILTGIFTGIHNFFRYDHRVNKHNRFSAKYSDLITDIETELIKKKKYRIPADVFVTTIKMKFDTFVFHEPVISKKFLN